MSHGKDQTTLSEKEKGYAVGAYEWRAWLTDPVFLASVAAGSQYVRTSVVEVTDVQPDPQS